MICRSACRSEEEPLQVRDFRIRLGTPFLKVASRNGLYFPGLFEDF
jgi:hypothetical protein